MVGLGDAGLDAVLDIGGLEPAVQARLGDPEVLGDVLQSSVGFASPGDPDHVLAELLGIGPGHGEHPSSGTSRHHRSDVTGSSGSPDRLHPYLRR